MLNNAFMCLVATAAIGVSSAFLAGKDSSQEPSQMRSKPALPPGEDRLRNEGRMPELNGAIGWLNSPPLSRESLRGKVVLVNFWTYTCINSLRPLP